MDDTADLEGLFFLEYLDNLIMGSTVMDDQRFANFAGKADLAAKGLALNITRCTVTVEIETGFTDGDDLGMGAELFQLGQRLSTDFRCVVGMDADRGVDVVILLRDGDTGTGTG